MVRSKCADVEVITASDGATALDMMNAMKDEILVVVTDMRMPVDGKPRVDGDEVAREANRLGISVVITTGTVDDVTADIGALTAAVFSKPFRKKELIQIAGIAAQERERLRAAAQGVTGSVAEDGVS